MAKWMVQNSEKVKNEATEGMVEDEYAEEADKSADDDQEEDEKEEEEEKEEEGKSIRTINGLDERRKRGG